MGHGQRIDKVLELQRIHFESMREQAQRFDGLKSVATSAHAALTDALPYVANDNLSVRMKDVLERLNIWGAHP